MNYSLAHLLAIVNAAIGIVAGALASAYLIPQHPSWLTGDVAGTCTILVTITVGLAALLPQVTRTPKKREDAYIAAMAGAPPDDVLKSRNLKVEQGPDGSFTVIGPEKPPPA